MKPVIITICLISLAPVVCACGADRLEPSQDPAIQSAIDNANNGVTVILDDFQYGSQANMDVYWKKGPRLNFTPAGGCGCPNDPNIGGGSNPVYDNGRLRLDWYNNMVDGTKGPWSEVMYDYNGVGGDWTLGGSFDPCAIGIQFDANMYTSTVYATDANYDKLYMALEDRAGHFGMAFNTDPYAAIKQMGLAQREWKVALSDMTNPNNVDLTEVNRLYLGIGRRGVYTTTSGGSGHIYFDNALLYEKHCEPTKVNLTGDLEGPRGLGGNPHTPRDCVVNYNDVFYFAAEWLYMEPVTITYDINAADEPDNNQLGVWYQFNETSGTTVADSRPASPKRNGTVHNYSVLRNNIMRFYTGYDGTGRCFNFQQGLRSWIEVPTSVMQGATTGQTFSFWIDADLSNHFEDWYPSVFMMFLEKPFYDAPGSTNDGNETQLIETQFPIDWPPRANGYGPMLRWVDLRMAGLIVSSNQGYSHQPWENLSVFSGRWNHYTLVYYTADTSMRVFRNGRQVAFRTDTVLPVWPEPNSFRIGTRCNKLNNPTHGFWQGKLDDFRIYTYALPSKQIQYITTSGTGSRVTPFIEPENYDTTTQMIDGQAVQIIDFRDFAALAGNWMSQQLWP